MRKIPNLKKLKKKKERKGIWQTPTCLHDFKVLEVLTLDETYLKTIKVIHNKLIANTIYSKTIVNTIPSKPIGNIIHRKPVVNIISSEPIVNTIHSKPIVNTIQNTYSWHIYSKPIVNIISSKSIVNTISNKAIVNLILNGDKQNIFSKIRNEMRMPTFSHLFDVMPEVLAIIVRQDKVVKWIKIGKAEVRLSPCALCIHESLLKISHRIHQKTLRFNKS